MLRSIKLEKIKLLDNSRSRPTKMELAGLMQSMSANGLLQPVRVKQLKGDSYELIFGFRRYNAAMKLGWDIIDCLVEDDAMNKEDQVVCNFVENFQRTDITPFEKGRILEELLTIHGLSLSEVATRVGTSQQAIKRMICIFKQTPDEFKDKVGPAIGGPYGKKGIIPTTVAAAINRMGTRRKLEDKQINKLYALTKKGDLDLKKVTRVDKKLEAGMSFNKALDEAKKTKLILIQLAVTEEDYAYLFKKDSPSKLIKEHLYGEGKFRLRKLRRP